MPTDYEAFYRENPNGLGKPTKEYVSFFDVYGKRNARVLDVECGQGRDALFIGRLGHTVTAVDISRSGSRRLSKPRRARASKSMPILRTSAITDGPGRMMSSWSTGHSTCCLPTIALRCWEHWLAPQWRAHISSLRTRNEICPHLHSFSRNPARSGNRSWQSVAFCSSYEKSRAADLRPLFAMTSLGSKAANRPPTF